GPAGYSSFPALLNDVLNNKNQFQPLLGTNFSANVTFLGVPNALSAQSTNGGNTVTLSIPIINFKQGFTGTNSSDVETQVKNFFLQSGSGVVGAFLKA